jgi:hypothetical protein
MIDWKLGIQTRRSIGLARAGAWRSRFDSFSYDDKMLRFKDRVNSIRLYTQLRKQAILHALQNIPVVNDLQVLALGKEDLFGVFRTAHRVGTHLRLLHLLAHLVRGVFAAQDEVVHGLQTEEREEVPGQRRDPSHIQVARAHTGLQHLLELRGEREWQFHWGSMLVIERCRPLGEEQSY